MHEKFEIEFQKFSLVILFSEQNQRDNLNRVKEIKNWKTKIDHGQSKETSPKPSNPSQSLSATPCTASTKAKLKKAAIIATVATIKWCKFF